jgi:serine/threonine-protein phosphatase 6 regulatory ankyrin repeat subunit B
MARYEQLVPELHKLLKQGKPTSDPEVKKLTKEIVDVATSNYHTREFENRFMKDKESMLLLPTDAIFLSYLF